VTRDLYLVGRVSTMGREGLTTVTADIFLFCHSWNLLGDLTPLLLTFIKVG